MSPLRALAARAVPSLVALVALVAPARSDLAAAAAASPDSVAPVRDSIGAEPKGPSQAPTASPSTGLEATTDPPWNPPQPRGDSAPWEYAVRLPGRLLSLPLVAVGYASERTLLYAQEHSLVTRTVVVIPVLVGLGITLQGAAIGDRAGLGGVVDFAPSRFPRVSGQVGASLRKYSRFGLAVSAGPAALDYRNDWRPRERFYGLGPSTDKDHFAGYAEQVESARFSLGFPRRPRGKPPARAAVEAWVASRSVVVTDGREPGFPVVSDLYPGVSSELGQRHEHLVYGLSLMRDGRDGRPHWTHGWRVQASAERFDKAPESLALHDPSAPVAQFTRYSAELETGFSFMRDPRSVRLLLRGVDQDITSGEEHFVVTDLSRLGGFGRLGGFTNGRFRDVDMAMGRLSYVFPLAQHFELDLHAEAGGVYSDLHTATIHSLDSSWGIALRPRTSRAPIGLVGVDFCRDGANVHWVLGGVE